MPPFLTFLRSRGLSASVMTLLLTAFVGGAQGSPAEARAGEPGRQQLSPVEWFLSECRALPPSPSASLPRLNPASPLDAHLSPQAQSFGPTLKAMPDGCERRASAPVRTQSWPWPISPRAPPFSRLA